MTNYKYHGEITSDEMHGHSPTTDDRVMMRWMQQEIRRMNAGIVMERKLLAALCREDVPSARTREGGTHVFDRELLRMLQDQLPLNVVDRLRLPILLYLDMEIADSTYLADEIAVSALQSLGEISMLRALHEGRVWISRPIAYAILRKYPTLIQIVMG